MGPAASESIRLDSRQLTTSPASSGCWANEQRTMKKWVILLGLALAAGHACAQQDGDGWIRAASLIDGHFFTEQPEPYPTVPIRAGLIKDSLGGRVAVTIYPEGTHLSAEAAELAIPVERVFCGKELLEAAQQTRLFTITMGTPEPLRHGVGQTMPPFREVDDAGRTWTEHDAKGRPVVLNFWYTGCRPCIREMPELNTWMEACPDALCLAVTWNSAEEIRPIVERQGFAFHRIVDARKLWDEFGVEQTPTTVIVDRKGVIRCVEIGSSSLQRRRLLECLEELETEK